MTTLATLAQFKERLGIEVFETEDDARLTNYLQLVTRRFEIECHRQFARTEAETFEFQADLPFVMVPRLPVESVSAIHLKSDETEGWVLQTVSYLLSQRGGLVRFVAGELGGADQIGRITYTGGFVLPGATAAPGQTELPDDLRVAAIEQAVVYWQNRDRQGLGSVSGDGGSVSQNPVSVVTPLDLLPTVRAILARYERWVNV